MSRSNKIPLKLVIVGDGGVGKSSCTIQILKRGFIEGDYDATIEDSYTTSLTVDGQEYEIEIIDTAGQEEYRFNLEGTCREGDGFILTYAIDSQDSFDQLPMFMHTIRMAKSERDCTQNPSPENTPFPFILLGNKCDKKPEDRVIYAQQGLSFSRTSGGLFYECSAKLRVNIDAAFESIVRATARSKLAKEEYIRRRNGKDDGLFNGNVAILQRERELAEERLVGKNGDGWEEDDEKSRMPRKKNPNLAMDRRRSFSVGGLGRRPESLGKEPGCCGSCTIC